MQMTQKMAFHIFGKLTILETANGAPTAVKLEVDPKSAVTISANGPMGNQPEQNLPLPFAVTRPSPPGTTRSR